MKTIDNVDIDIVPFVVYSSTVTTDKPYKFTKLIKDLYYLLYYCYTLSHMTMIPGTQAALNADKSNVQDHIIPQHCVRFTTLSLILSQIFY